MSGRVEVGSLWVHKRGRYPGIVYRIAELGEVGCPTVLLERVDSGNSRSGRRQWETEDWLLKALTPREAGEGGG